MAKLRSRIRIISLAVAFASLCGQYADATPIGYGQVGMAVFSLSVTPDAIGGFGGLKLGAPGGDLPETGYYTSRSVSQINSDGSVTKLSFSGGDPGNPAGLYYGSTPSGPADPLSGDASATPQFYASTGNGGSWILQTCSNSVAQSQNTFSFLWGDVTQFNTLSFYDGADLVAAISGEAVLQVAQAASSAGIAGEGSYYITVSTDGAAFDRVTGTTSAGFFSATSFGERFQVVSEPSTVLALLGGLTFLLFSRRA